MKLTKHGPNTITSKKALRRELKQIRVAGLAASDQELAAELYAIAAAIRNEARDVVAAVNLAAHSSMISLEELVDALGPHWERRFDLAPLRRFHLAPPPSDWRLTV